MFTNEHAQGVPWIGVVSLGRKEAISKSKRTSGSFCEQNLQMFNVEVSKSSQRTRKRI